METRADVERLLAPYKQDAIQEALARYSTNLDYESLPSEAVHAAKVRLVDTLGSLLGGYNGDPCRIARAVAAPLGTTAGSTIIGTSQKTAPDLAAYVNGTTARYVEMNDVYHWPAAGGGHPSDVIMPVLAAGEAEGCSGRELITGIVLAYEIFLCLSHSVRTPGFDFINNVCIASAIGAAKVMRLDARQTSECISLAVVPNNALSQARTGPLTHQKAAASGQAGRAGVFAAMLAREGMHGANAPFVGSAGWAKVVARGQFSLAPMGGDEAGDHFKIVDTIIKPRSSCATTLSSILAAEKAAASLSSPEDIESVLVEAYDRVVHLAEGEWSYHPDTRETADHSVPYVVAAALTDGTVTPATFYEDRLWDPRLRELVQKVKVVASDEFNAGYRRLPLEHGTRVTVTTRSGTKHVGEIRALKGGLSDPMNDPEIEAKFRFLSQESLSSEQISRALEKLWRLEATPDVSDIPAAFVLGT